MLLDLSRPLVLGYGASGSAAARFLQLHGGNVTIVEQSLAKVTEAFPRLKQQGIELLHESALLDFSPYSLVITSPGLSYTHPWLVQAKLSGKKMIGEMELGLLFLQGPAIGITGTNGKTSVTSLTHHVLKTAGIACHAVGNIGLPITEVLLDPAKQKDLFIIEMSSFQLEGLSLPCLKQGVILNLTPNHLDRHGTMQEYARAKCALAACILKEGMLYVHPQVAKNYSHLLGESYQQFEAHPNHIQENFAASFALCRHYGITQECFNEAARSWAPPAHRIAFVREKAGVRYYNDSKATNLAAVEKAVHAMNGPVLLLAGGVHKGASYSPWIKAFEGKVRHLFLFGSAALQIGEELGMFYSITQTDSLYAALHAAARMASCGDVILLSPGCASYDMFKDYIHRGESFEKWVREL